MRKQGRLEGRKHEHSGRMDDSKELRILNISALLLMSLYNIINHVLRHGKAVDLFLYTMPFLVLVALLFIFKNKLTMFIVYIFIGGLTIIFAERVIEYSGMVFVLMASGIIANHKLRIVSIVISFIALSIRLTLLSESVPVTIQMVLLFCFIVYSSYLIFFKKPKRRVDLWKEISEKEKAILKLFMRGKDYARISHILNLTDKKDSIRTIITRCRTKSGCENDIQFGIWLSDKG